VRRPVAAFPFRDDEPKKAQLANFRATHP
jgi:hypothetical protein